MLQAEGAQWERLLQHLKADPAALQKSNAELASQFDLPPELVEAIRSGFRTTEQRKTSSGVSPLAILAGSWAKSSEKIFAWTERPYPFMISSTLFAGGLITAINLGRLAWGKRLPAVNQTLWVVIAMVVVAVMVYQLSVTFRLKNAIFTVASTLLVSFMTGLVAFIAQVLFSRADSITGRIFFSAVLAAGVSLSMMVMYGAMAGLVTATAIVLSARDQKALAETLTRKELLAYYFDLKNRLERGPDAQIKPTAGWILFLRSSMVPFTFMFSFGIGLFTVIAYWVNGATKITAQTEGFGLAIMYLDNVLAVVFTVIVIGFCYLAERFRTVLALGAGWFFGSVLPLLLPLGPCGPAFVLDAKEEILLGGVLNFGMMALVHLASLVHFSADRLKKQALGDPAILIEEMVKVQGLLAEEESTMTLMVVDVSGSTRMKAGEQPFQVEHSFGQYQAWVRQIVESEQGQIFSTSGDGTIASFNHAQNALEAAKKIQRDIEWFNETHNLLKIGFMVRIGLHSGDVQADLKEVQYNQVIDVAAHAEKVAPVGGIVATEAFVTLHRDPNLEPLNRVVDGWNIYVISPKLFEKSDGYSPSAVEHVNVERGPNPAEGPKQVEQ